MALYTRRQVQEVKKIEKTLWTRPISLSCFLPSLAQFYFALEVYSALDWVFISEKWISLLHAPFFVLSPPQYHLIPTKMAATAHCDQQVTFRGEVLTLAALQAPTTHFHGGLEAARPAEGRPNDCCTVLGIFQVGWELCRGNKMSESQGAEQCWPLIRRPWANIK